MKRIAVRNLAALLVVVLGTVSPAFGQSTSQRPFRGLFGGSGTDPTVHHSLDFTASLLEGYDNNALADTGGGLFTPSSTLQASSFYTGASAGLSYGWRGQRLQVAANAGTDARYYQNRQEFLGLSHFAAGGFDAALGRRTRLFINQSVNYTPSYFASLFSGVGSLFSGVGSQLSGIGLPPAGGSIGGGSDYYLTDLHARIYDTSASLTHGISRRASLELISNFRNSNFSAAGLPSRDLRAYGVGGRYLHSLSRNATLRVGYIYRAGDYGLTASSSRTVLHDIDVGVDYGRSLSLSRRTAIAFGFGSTIINQQLDPSDQVDLQYRVVGNAGLNHEIGRSWLAALTYSRGVGLAEGMSQPVFSDTLNASLGGLLSRRVDFRASGGVSVGDVGLRSAQSAFRTYTASSRIRVGISAMWAVYGEYLYYNYDLGNIGVVPGLPSSLARHSGHVGLSFWLPLLRR